MLGLGIGGYVAGVLADRAYAEGRNLLRVFASIEFAVGLLALGISVLLPHLGDFSAAISSYTRDARGWYVLSPASVRGARRDRDRAAHTGHDAHGRHADPANPSSDSARSRPNRPLVRNQHARCRHRLLPDRLRARPFRRVARYDNGRGRNQPETATGALLLKSQNPNPKSQIPKQHSNPESRKLPNPESRFPSPGLGHHCDARDHRLRRHGRSCGSVISPSCSASSARSSRYCSR